MRAKKGTLLHKEGTLLHRASAKSRSGVNYRAAIAAALRKELGRSRGATKTVMQWTNASERSVKNWFAGSKGPSGENLIMLVRHSDAVWIAMAGLFGRQNRVPDDKLLAVRGKLDDAIRSLDRIAPRQ